MRKIGLIVAMLFVSGAAIQSCDMVPSKVMVYTALCEGTLSGGECHGTILPWRKMVFRISGYEQDITCMVCGSWKRPVHLKSCTVVDKYNWCGEHPDGNGREMMIKGTLVASKFSYNEYCLSMWRWWYAKLKLAIRGYENKIEKKVVLLWCPIREEEQGGGSFQYCAD